MMFSEMQNSVTAIFAVTLFFAFAESIRVSAAYNGIGT